MPDMFRCNRPIAARLSQGPASKGHLGANHAAAPRRGQELRERAFTGFIDSKSGNEDVLVEPWYVPCRRDQKNPAPTIRRVFAEHQGSGCPSLSSSRNF